MRNFSKSLFFLLLLSCSKTSLDRDNPIDGKELATLSTTEITNITSNSATSGGSITNNGGTPITSRGICWSTSVNPSVTLSSLKTVDSSGSGSYISNLTLLLPNTTYYVRAYATNIVGTAYGSEITFKTKSTLATITTSVISNIAATTATGGGIITSDGGASVTAKGVCWSITNNATVALTTKTNDGTSTGSFSSSLSNLSAFTTYYARAYATNTNGTVYGNEVSFKTLSKPVTLTTSPITGITNSTAQGGGIITDDGGTPVTSRGLCWSTSTSPTVLLSTKTIDATGGIGTFSNAITGLNANTTYYARAYATSVLGTVYGTEISFKTTVAGAVVTTASVSAILSNAAVSGGNVSDDGGSTVSGRGICWSTVTNPTASLSTRTIDGNGKGAFTSNMTNLTAGTTYFVRAYATNSGGTVYGTEVSFRTTNGVAVVTTTNASGILSTAAVSGGNVTDDGGSTISAKGICWSLVTNPTVSVSTKTNDGNGTGVFTSNMTNLTAGTTYFVRAYATNTGGTFYGNEINFQTTFFTLPSISTTSVSGITSNTANTGGNVSNEGGATVTARGVCWGTVALPTIALSTKTSNGTGSGNFTSSITGLLPGTSYYVRSYATNTAGTAYGTELSFQTPFLLPTVSTTAITGVTSNAATSGGNITDAGGTTITQRGVCWSTAINPTVALSTKTSNSTGTGVYISSISGLSANTKYYIRAYATSSAGTSYGTELNFTTSP